MSEKLDEPAGAGVGTKEHSRRQSTKELHIRDMSHERHFATDEFNTQLDERHLQVRSSTVSASQQVTLEDQSTIDAGANGLRLKDKHDEATLLAASEVEQSKLTIEGALLSPDESNSNPRTRRNVSDTSLAHRANQASTPNA